MAEQSFENGAESEAWTQVELLHRMAVRGGSFPTFLTGWAFASQRQTAGREANDMTGTRCALCRAQRGGIFNFGTD